MTMHSHPDRRRPLGGLNKGARGRVVSLDETGVVSTLPRSFRITEATPMSASIAAAPPRPALVGNPNCGKTALFNALTGARNALLGLYERAKIFLVRAGAIIFAGMLSHAPAPAPEPIGFNWQISVALIPGMAAREVAPAADWSLPGALASPAWYVIAPQCVSTLSVVKRETNSWFWPAAMFVYMTGPAYVAAFVTFRTASAFLGG